MKGFDFSTRPDGDVEVREEGKAPYILNENHREVITIVFDRIRNEYPKAYNRLTEVYKDSIRNKRFFEFLSVRRFIKCNWSLYDNVFDIDSKGNFHFEFCMCPMRGECRDWKVICEPERSSLLSPAEINVVRLVVKGLDNEAIAEILHLSVHTVHNHRNNVLRKLKVNNTASIISYWNKHNLK